MNIAVLPARTRSPPVERMTAEVADVPVAIAVDGDERLPHGPRVEETDKPSVSVAWLEIGDGQGDAGIEKEAQRGR